MKTMNLYEIRDQAIKSKRAVFSIQQLSNLIRKPKKIAKVYSSRMVSKNLAIKLIKGRISFTDDEFVIATQLIEPSYISLYSALHFYDLTRQIPRFIECVTPSASRKYEKIGVVYHKVPSSFFYGYEKKIKNNSYIFIATPEKALIDLVYFNSISRQSVEEIKKQLNKSKLKQLVFNFRGRGRKKLEKWLL
jgi:predicted transcriptional regulator of viral defense system